MADAFSFFQQLPSMLETPSWPQGVTVPPQTLEQLQKEYLQELTSLWQRGLTASSDEPDISDRRFKSEAWKANPMAHMAAALYLLNTKTMMSLAQSVQGDVKTKARLQFAVEQWAAASAPSNFLAFNPEAIQKAIDTKGESLAQGIGNMLHDLRQGHVSMTDESLFEVGRNVATTEGQVVYENELFQLIEYKPLTAKVYQRPFLLIPPCINKFYILDLQPENSFIRYAVEQGHRTFVVSWRNPDESMARVHWDDYVERGAIEAIRITRAIGGAGKGTINALGFCVGGTILTNALAVLAARKLDWVESATLLTTLIDFTHTGVLDVFIDEAFVKFREMQFEKGGLMAGRDMASTFSFLRPNDLVWNYVVGNYLKGETPPPFDLLYWNSDSTNLPGPMYAWYLRNTYLENRLVQPKKAKVCSEAVDLRQVKLPMYIYGSREDHIVPIEGAYASTQCFPGPKRFVMGASGHIAGVINPPAAKKRSHWLNESKKFPSTHAQWLSHAQEKPGSWWTDWSRWLQSHAGKAVVAPKQYGRGAFKPIESAPGRYVKAKA